jgi:hypothetical protein
MDIPILKTSSMYKFILLLFALALTACEDSGNSPDDDTQSPPENSIIEKEIAPEGGNLYIVDKNNNTIEITFPEAVQLSISLVLRLKKFVAYLPMDFSVSISRAAKTARITTRFRSLRTIITIAALTAPANQS